MLCFALGATGTTADHHPLSPRGLNVVANAGGMMGMWGLMVSQTNKSLSITGACLCLKDDIIVFLRPRVGPPKGQLGRSNPQTYCIGPHGGSGCSRDSRTPVLSLLLPLSIQAVGGDLWLGPIGFGSTYSQIKRHKLVSSQYDKKTESPHANEISLRQ